VDTTFDLLRAQPFLAALTDWQLESLSRIAHRAVIHAGHRVCHEGECADRLWLIIAGAVTVDSATPDGSTEVVETLGPGAVLGWSSLVPPYRSHFDAAATEATMVLGFDGCALRELCNHDPMLGYRLTQALLGVVTHRLEAQRAARPR
jgi:CRP/FNR family transcriptional regulator, cyclic AMP receptor protein